MTSSNPTIPSAANTAFGKLSAASSASGMEAPTMNILVMTAL